MVLSANDFMVLCIGFLTISFYLIFLFFYLGVGRGWREYIYYFIGGVILIYEIYA